MLPWKQKYILLLFALIIGWVYACDTELTLEEKAKVCQASGTCTLQFTYDKDNVVSTSSKSCSFDAQSTLSCGDCTDKQVDENGVIVSKKCRHCNLCTADFACFVDKDCKEEQPLCEEGQCIACRKNSDCTGDKKICQNQQCVECQTDSDCPNQALPSCKNNVCSICQCLGKGKALCLKKSDNTVECVECLDSSHCSGNTPKCDTSIQTCVAGCLKDDECSKGERCDQGVCKECRTNQDCLNPQKPSCGSEGRCLCLSDQDCPLRFRFCNQSLCIECKKDTDCSKGFPTCQEGICSLQRCDQDSDCQTPEYSKCQTLGREKVCVGCLKTEDCATGRNCDLASFTCVQP